MEKTIWSLSHYLYRATRFPTSLYFHLLIRLKLHFLDIIVARLQWSVCCRFFRQFVCHLVPVESDMSLDPRWVVFSSCFLPVLSLFPWSYELGFCGNVDYWESLLLCCCLCILYLFSIYLLLVGLLLRLHPRLSLLLIVQLDCSCICWTVWISIVELISLLRRWRFLMCACVCISVWEKCSMNMWL